MKPLFLVVFAAFLMVPVSGVEAAPKDELSFTVSKVTMVPKPPTCEARTTKRIIRSGGFFDIVWKSDAEKMVGLVQGKEFPPDGRQRMAIAFKGKHEFPLTFIGENGATTTCPVKVFVHAKRD